VVLRFFTTCDWSLVLTAFHQFHCHRYTQRRNRMQTTSVSPVRVSRTSGHDIQTMRDKPRGKKTSSPPSPKAELHRPEKLRRLFFLSSCHVSTTKEALKHPVTSLHCTLQMNQVPHMQPPFCTSTTERLSSPRSHVSFPVRVATVSSLFCMGSLERHTCSERTYATTLLVRAPHRMSREGCRASKKASKLQSVA